MRDSTSYEIASVLSVKARDINSFPKESWFKLYEHLLLYIATQNEVESSPPLIHILDSFFNHPIFLKLLCDQYLPALQDHPDYTVGSLKILHCMEKFFKPLANTRNSTHCLMGFFMLQYLNGHEFERVLAEAEMYLKATHRKLLVNKNMPLSSTNGLKLYKKAKQQERLFLISAIAFQRDLAKLKSLPKMNYPLALQVAAEFTNFRLLTQMLDSDNFDVSRGINELKVSDYDLISSHLNCIENIEKVATWNFQDIFIKMSIGTFSLLKSLCKKGNLQAGMVAPLCKAQRVELLKLLELPDNNELICYVADHFIASYEQGHLTVCQTIFNNPSLNRLLIRSGAFLKWAFYRRLEDFILLGLNHVEESVDNISAMFEWALNNQKGSIIDIMVKRNNYFDTQEVFFNIALRHKKMEVVKDLMRNVFVKALLMECQQKSSQAQEVLLAYLLNRPSYCSSEMAIHIANHAPSSYLRSFCGPFFANSHTTLHGLQSFIETICENNCSELSGFVLREALNKARLPQAHYRNFLLFIAKKSDELDDTWEAKSLLLQVLAKAYPLYRGVAYQLLDLYSHHLNYSSISGYLGKDHPLALELN